MKNIFKKSDKNKEKKVKELSASEQKILDAKKIIASEKKKIKKEKLAIRNRRISKFKKTRIGRILFFFSDERNSYSFSNVFWVTIVSLVLGFFACFSLLSIIFGGRNYFKLGRQLNKFFDVYDVMVENYYGDADKDKLIEAAIDGMVSSVGDVYTNYLDTDTTSEFSQMVDGTYEGIGCTISLQDDNIVVVEVYDDTPASKAGLLSGDIITKVNDKDLVELGTDGLADYIKNGKDSKFDITVKRGEEEKKLTLIRGKIEIPAVSYKVFEENGKKVGYVYISIFSAVSSKQFKKGIDELEKEKIDGLIIDVRNNNGGYLTSVTDILSYLLPKGKILYQTQVGSKKRVTKDRTKESRDYPIAVLANGASASASEILAAAIKESYNGYLVGTKTYGKGTVQQLKELSDGSVIKYTTQNWLTPNGNWIDKEGITPTDEIELSNEYLENPSVDTDNQFKKALELVSK